MGKVFLNKRVLITGICGTIGRELLRQVLEEKPSQVVGLDNNETELFILAEKNQLCSNVDFFSRIPGMLTVFRSI